MRAAKELGQGQTQTQRSNGTASVLLAPRQAALARIGGTSTPLTQPLRPGESYTTDFVFDVPNDAQKLRLLITEDDPETYFVIGHENSLLHKKIYLSLDTDPTIGGQDFTSPSVLSE